jgi:pyrimidine deaminase RibD-like protein
VSTSALTADEQWMALALRVAEHANGRSNPNPAVGAVLVRDGRVIASGATERYRDRHAERVAIMSVDRDLLAGATLYVTLEPCSHVGHQPPCADLVTDCQLDRCVVGIVDPNPLVSGSGLKRIAAAGTEVIHGVLSAEVAAWHLPFVYRQTARAPYRACLCLPDASPAPVAVEAYLARLRRRADVYVTPASLLQPSVEAELHTLEKSSSWVRIVLDDGRVGDDEVETLAARAALGEQIIVSIRADAGARIRRRLSEHAGNLVIADWALDPRRELTEVLERTAEHFRLDPAESSVLVAYPGQPPLAPPDATVVHVVSHEDGEALAFEGFELLSQLYVGGRVIREFVDGRVAALLQGV